MTVVANPCAESQVAQLDRNEALRGPPRGAIERVHAAIARGHIYPHEALATATAAAANHFGVDPRQLILTTGVDEAADLCILELGDPYTVTPGFDGYGDRAAALNHRCRAFALTAEHALPRELLGAVTAGRLVMLASPNNPTANAFAPQSLRTLLWRSRICCWTRPTRTSARTRRGWLAGGAPQPAGVPLLLEGLRPGGPADRLPRRRGAPDRAAARAAGVPDDERAGGGSADRRAGERRRLPAPPRARGGHAARRADRAPACAGAVRARA